MNRNIFQFFSYQKLIAIFPIVFFWVANFGGSVFNWLFNIVASSRLDLGEFANLTFYVTLQYLVSIMTVGLLITTNKFTAEYLKNKQLDKLKQIVFLGELGLVIGSILTILYLFSFKFWAPAFNFPVNQIIIFSTAPMIMLMFVVSWYRGILNAQQSLIAGGVCVLVEVIVKLGVGLYAGFVGGGLILFLSAIPLSILFATIFSYIYIKPIIKKNIKIFQNKWSLSVGIKKFFLQAILFQIGVAAIINIDIIAVNFYLNTEQAGIYSLLSLVGKTLFFINSSFSAMLIPLVSSYGHRSKLSKFIFYLALGIILIISAVFIFLINQFPAWTLGILIKGKYNLILPYVIQYSIAIVMLSLAMTFSTYHLLKKNYIFPLITLAGVIVEIVVFMNFHSSIKQIVNGLMFTTASLMVIMMGTHISKVGNLKNITKKVI